jgi:cell division protein FtsQ
MPGAPRLSRDLSDDFAAELPGERRRRGAGRRATDLDADLNPALADRRNKGLRLRFRGRVPKSVAGRVIAGSAVLALFGVFGFGVWEARAAMLRDPRLAIPSSDAIQISGNNHLTRSELLTVFGGDVDRNILTVPLAQRRAQLESLPWVEHATVMRLLPNAVRVAITERKPVAFVRTGGTIGLVDANGVLLDMSPDNPADHAYSFPVVTGIDENLPAGTRAARMKVYLRFTSALDAGSEKVSKKLSEIDLTDPEDVKALIPDNGTDVLVHFGGDDFLTRYQRYEQNLPDWKTRYPKLASADMRYERDVVLEMAPGSTVPIAGAAAASSAAAAPAAAKKAAAKKPAPKPVVKARVKAKAAAKAHPQQAFSVPRKAGH